MSVLLSKVVIERNWIIMLGSFSKNAITSLLLILPVEDTKVKSKILIDFMQNG